jgi:hypothetical protein
MPLIAVESEDVALFFIDLAGFETRQDDTCPMDVGDITLLDATGRHFPGSDGPALFEGSAGWLTPMGTQRPVMTAPLKIRS